MSEETNSTQKMKRKQLVSEYFSYLDNKDILLKIFTQEQYDAFINESKKPNPQSLKEIKKNGKNEITEKKGRSVWTEQRIQGHTERV